VIIGLTGKYAAGKGTVAEVLKKHGFAYHSLSDVIRGELKRRGIPESRENLLACGNDLRSKGGPGALATMIVTELEADAHPDHIVDSIRTPAEVEGLRTHKAFWLIGVDADQRLRFQRLLSRGRQGDPTTFEVFAALEARESKSDDPKAQQLDATFALADVVVNNDGGLEDLEAQVLGVLEDLRSR